MCGRAANDGTRGPPLAAGQLMMGHEGHHVQQGS